MGAPRTNATRALDARGVPYEVRTFPDEVHSAGGVAEVLGVPAASVCKTLVVIPSEGHPLLVMVAGDRELDLKRVARAAGVKKARMAHHDEAEALTGLRVGGISALALLGRSFRVYLDQDASAPEHVFVSAGARGVNLRIGVDDLVRVTRARRIEASTRRR